MIPGIQVEGKEKVGIDKDPPSKLTVDVANAGPEHSASCDYSLLKLEAPSWDQAEGWGGTGKHLIWRVGRGKTETQRQAESGEKSSR